MLKLTADKHEASGGLFATTELLVLLTLSKLLKWQHHSMDRTILPPRVMGAADGKAVVTSSTSITIRL